MTSSPRAECPECASSVPLQHDVEREIVPCAEGGVEPEAVRDGGIALRLAPEGEEHRGK